MCGRYALATDKETFSLTFPNFHVPESLPPRFNISPTQPVPVVANNRARDIELFHWGLIPYWAKDRVIGNKMINARAETLAEKPSFKHAFKRRRCLILTDGFYEWQRDPETKTKTPIHIRMKSRRPFAFAGLWETWKDEEGAPLRSCTIITTEPNELMEKVHNRMPVILRGDDYEDWMSPDERTADSLQDLLIPYEADEMMAYPVSTLVNSPVNELPDCREPVGDLVTW
jgi:putative SOS response-associated peptidase YedK